MDWVEESSVQRSSLYSNTLIELTDDCKRVNELILTMKSKYPEPIFTRKKDKQSGRWIRERWLLLDGWEGLSEFTQTSDKEWVLKSIIDAKKYGGDLRQLLPAVSDELDKGDTVLVIQNLLKPDTAGHINNALRSWSTSDRLRTIDSTIIIFTEDMSIFPQNVWSKMKIIDVPKSLEHEREHIIKELQTGWELPNKDMLNETQLKAAIRMCAGMNHDQIDAAINESIIRHNHINLDAIAQTKTELIGKDPTIDIIQQPKFGFEAVGGYDALKNRIKDDIILPFKHPEIAEKFKMKSPRGFIFFGPPGTGKTLLIKCTGKELNMSVLIFRPENVLSKYVGESERSLNRVFKIADSMSPCILFVDEIDRLAKRANASGSDGGAQVHREIFSMFLEKLGDENREWIFIGATNRVEDIDEAMRRTGRIDSLVPVPYPDKKAREQIFKIHATIKRQLPLADDINFKMLASNKYTYMWSGSDIEQLVIRTAKYVMKDCIKNKITRSINMDDFEIILNSFNVNKDANETLQEHTKEQAKELTNDTRLMNIFDEAQDSEETTRVEKAKALKRNQ